ncbi:general transcriptional corepressor trfA-like [Euwallacea fornicatus]|uniref:general transcriptional corepressor trfA-like n=1 Tax=Euwallacea fornicatus TaxID=995702 RepID=UPI00338DEC31
MWSKQADTTRTKTNMTSFKNKITNRKSKNATSVDSKAVADESDQDKKKQLPSQQQQQQQAKAANQKTGRNRARNKSKKDAAKKQEEKGNNNVPDNKTKSIKQETDKTPPESVTPVDECDVVVLRNPNNAVRAPNSAVKRYSDSFVLENQTEEPADDAKVSAPLTTPLTRALSGFFVMDQAKKHNRRFSDLFRPVNSKFSDSTESLKIQLDKNVPEKTAKADAKTKKSKLPRKVDDAKKGSQQSKPDFVEPATIETSSSYLKRVKSRIYKSKSDDCAKIELDNKYKILKPKRSLELNGRIPEEDVASPTGVIQKSLGHFHFSRLARQATNLEQISRPFGSQKSVENPLSPGAERPVLAKSKSSSAINLSLLRARRAKLTDQACAPLCKDEFDFIAFGDVRPFGSNTSLHNVVSWMHVNKGEALAGFFFLCL